MRIALVTSCLPLLLAGGACHHQQPAVVPPTPTNLAEAAPAPAPAPAGPKACRGDRDCGDRQLCLRGVCTDIDASLAACRLVRVHFDYDSAYLRPTDLTGLQRVARCLRADRAATVRIEGNADERGTTEYNLALGDRRATAVATYLGNLGVTPAQLRTVSYGEEKPLCEQRTETCWSQNRRAAVKPRLAASTGGKP